MSKPCHFCNDLNLSCPEGCVVFNPTRGGPYPPDGTYRLTLTNGRVMTRPMWPGWVWDDVWDGAVIERAERVS